MLPYYGPPFRYDEIEEKKHERELQYRLELQKLESERRREKREHEVQLLQIMMAMKGSSSAPVPAAHQYQPNTSYAPSLVMLHIWWDILHILVQLPVPILVMKGTPTINCKSSEIKFQVDR